MVGALAAAAILVAALRRSSSAHRRKAFGGQNDAPRDGEVELEVRVEAQVEAEVGSVELHFANFDEAPILEVERAFELLVAAGRIRLEPPARRLAASDGVAGQAPLPDHVGPVYRRLLAQARAVELVEVQVSIELDACIVATDPIGGWKLAASPDEIDVRLAPFEAGFGNETGDVVLDATWSPRGSGEIMVHSTILHFLVRSVVGDRLPS